MSKSYSYRKRIQKLVKGAEKLSRLPFYSGRISTGYECFDNQELIYPTGLTLIAGKINAVDDLFFNLAWKCHLTVSPLKTCYITFHKSFENTCARFAAIETNASLIGKPRNIYLTPEQLVRFKKQKDEDNLRINSEPPLRIDDLIKYMRSEFDDWAGIFFIDSLSGFIYDDWQTVLEKLHLFAAETQRPIVLKKWTHYEEGENDDKRELTYLDHPLYKLVCNHIIYVTLPPDSEIEDERYIEFEILIESNKDIGKHEFFKMIQDYATGIVKYPSNTT